MDSFSIIQNFFSRMTCNICSQHFEPDGIELIREDRGVFIVSVFCHSCQRQIGVAMVGLDMQKVGARRFQDPELTEAEVERLSQFGPVTEDDVLSAHEFFDTLGSDWMRFIPEAMRSPNTAPETESPSD
jgi:hypothetical protein